jgi:hypothetical protein
MSDAVALAVLFFSKTKLEIGSAAEADALEAAAAEYEADAIGPLLIK